MAKPAQANPADGGTSATFCLLLFHDSTLPFFHPFVLPFFHPSSIPLFQSFLFPFFHSSVSLSFHSSSIPIFHYSVFLLFHSPSPLSFHHSNLPVFQPLLVSPRISKNLSLSKSPWTATKCVLPTPSFRSLAVS